ncbi:MAG: DHHA1 domain-containing protein [Anaerotruncus sp.]|nr:MAG: DHHA1 domain-containing protein [Anaerotruncus sp.]
MRFAQWATTLKQRAKNVVGVVAGAIGDKASIVAVCGKEAIAKGVKAGNLVKEIAKLANGGGGGRPDSAMAGAKDVSKLDDALAAAKKALLRALRNK